MKSSPVKVWSRLWLILLVLSTLFFSSTPVQARNLTDSEPPAFSDGNWVGNFSMYTSPKNDVISMKISYNGKLGLISSNGQVNGDWTLSGMSTYTGDITGLAVFDGGGKISGSSAEPVISTKSLVATMDVTVDGMHTQTQVDMGSSSGNMSLKLVSATCSQVVADIEAPVTSGYNQAGMQASVSGSFVATRVGDLKGANATDYQQQVGDLLDKTEALKQNAIDKNGINFSDLNKLVTKAENLNTAIKKNAACGKGGGKQFLTSITGTIANLAYFALSHPELFTTEELSRIVTAALGVGAMGSGAVNSQQASDLLTKFTQEFNNRLTDAQTNKGCSEAVQIQITASMLGDANLKQQAQAVAGQVC